MRLRINCFLDKKKVHKKKPMCKTVEMHGKPVVLLVIKYTLIHQMIEEYGGGNNY